MTPAACQPADVQLRVSGDLPAIASALRVLRDAAEIEGLEFGEMSRPYPNRREPGYRVYVTLRFPPGADAVSHPMQPPPRSDGYHASDTRSRGAAHSRQAIRRPAAPSRRHLP